MKQMKVSYKINQVEEDVKPKEKPVKKRKAKQELMEQQKKVEPIVDEK